MRGDRREAGYTLIELAIGMVLALVVVLALGRLILANQRSWEWGRDRAVLQQNTSEALEWMARSVRAARTLQVVGTAELRTYDESGTLAHTYERVTAGGEGRLREDGSDLVDRRCTAFSVTADDDTTSVTLWLELEDDAGSRVGAETRATLRNRTFTF